MIAGIGTSSPTTLRICGRQWMDIFELRILQRCLDTFKSLMDNIILQLKKIIDILVCVSHRFGIGNSRFLCHFCYIFYQEPTGNF